MQGTLAKMTAELKSSIEYALPIGEESLPLNQFIGKHLQLKFSGNIVCTACGRKTKKSFSQGFCYPCMRSLACCDMCIMKPETCHFDQGTCREPEWAIRHCMVSHYVYLANTSGLKVGITRHTQIPTRWIDQGATQARPIFAVSTRKVSGLVEIALAKQMADKTNWRAILKGNAEPLDLVEKALVAIPQIEERIESIRDEFGADAVTLLDEDVVSLSYPVLEFPEKIVSHNFDKNPLVEGTLMGIKGQYLIFDTGVINIRKFTSYEVEVLSPEG